MASDRSRRPTPGRVQAPGPLAAARSGARGPARWGNAALAGVLAASTPARAEEAGPAAAPDAAPVADVGAEGGASLSAPSPGTEAPLPAASPTPAAAPSPEAAAPGPAPAAAVDGPAPAAPAAPAWAGRPHIASTLREGSTGADVEALQRALGVAVTGTFDAATTEAVVAWQRAHHLDDDGIAGRGTLTAMGLRDPFRSAHHTDDAFIPRYRATAYSESDQYRTEADPYAVGAITNPRREDDDGGKTYGTYQFESYVYRDGTRAADATVDGSTLQRFARWEDNPYGERLRAVIDEHGVASAQFDALWRDLTARENRAFGQAQERFLEHDTATGTDTFFDTAGIAAGARTDDDLRDVVIGTVNQYGGLAGGQARHVAAAQQESGRTFDADEAGRSLQDFKAENVEANFRRSPNAWDGIRERIRRERGLFE